jgi:hypothetical protein
MDGRGVSMIDDDVVEAFGGGKETVAARYGSNA